MIALRWLVGAALVGLAGCGTDRGFAGRPGGDQTENGILARAVDSVGNVLAGARVVVLPSQTADSNATDPRRIDTTTDSVGQVLLRNVAPGSYRLEIRQDGRAVQFAATVGLHGISDAGTRTPRATGSVQGVAQAGSIVAARGLPHWIRSDASGRFRLDSLPTGLVELVSPDGAHAWKNVSIGQTVQAGTLRQDSSGQILLDDFEDGDTQHRWAPLVGNGWWYVSTSAGIATTPSNVTTQFWAGYDSVSPERGKAFHVSFDFDSAKTNPWAEVGVGLAGPSTGNLSGLTAVSFWAKGTGAFAVHIRSKTLGRIETYVSPTGTWKEYILPIQSFRKNVSVDSTTTVEQILSSATGLAWESTAAGEIWLDEIRLIGVSPKSVWGDISPP